ncbi:glycosyltransferase [Chitinophagaceae bacterium MMS25-I14]
MMPDRKPAVTVLLPAYNVAGYIKDAVESVLQQQFTDFELLIINDGSTDNTLEVLSQFHDERIRIVSQENQGVVGALNNGLKLCRTELIARFDADDICYPDRLQLQYDFMNAHPDYVAVGGDVAYIDQHGEFVFTYHSKAYRDEDIRKIISTECSLVHSAVMYRKSAVLQAGGYDKNAWTFEDHFLWKKLLGIGKICNLRKTLIAVRFNPGSVTVDERWRGKEFRSLKYASIESGIISDADGRRIREIFRSQNFDTFKKAAYHAMMGKKYLWNNYQLDKARIHLRKAIEFAPSMPAPYLLLVLSVLPSTWIKYIYRVFKKNTAVS